MSQNGQTQQQAQAGRAGPTGAPTDEMGHFVSAILGSTEAEWTEIFAGIPRIAEASQLQLPRPGSDGQPNESSQLAKLRRRGNVSIGDPPVEFGNDTARERAKVQIHRH
jgi:hypothetical protein